MSQENVLFIAHRIPYPPNKGDKIRTYHMLRYLAGRYRVTVAFMIDDPDDLKHLHALDEMADRVYYALHTPLMMKFKALKAIISGMPFTRSCFYSDSLQKDIDKCLEANDIQAVICFCSSSADYVFRSKHRNSLNEKVLLMDLIDVDSEKWRQYAVQKSGLIRWLYKREAKILRTFEQQIVTAFDQTFLVSEEEKKLLAEYADATKIEALSNGVDLGYFSSDKCLKKSDERDLNRLVFSGAMDYWPNIEGALWFADEVFPAVKKYFPEAVFCIAGRNPDERLIALQKRCGIEVTGTVPDIRDYLLSATICVAPLKIARGIQNKVLEGMAMSKAVVATSGAATGLTAITGKEFVVANSAREMSSAIISLLRDSDKRERIGIEARQYVERAHSWDAHLAKINKWVEKTT